MRSKPGDLKASSPRSLDRDKNDANRRDYVPKVRRWRQPSIFSINPKELNVARFLICRQQPFAGWIEREVARCLASACDALYER